MKATSQRGISMYARGRKDGCSRIKLGFSAGLLRGAGNKHGRPSEVCSSEHVHRMDPLMQG